MIRQWGTSGTNHDIGDNLANRWIRPIKWKVPLHLMRSKFALRLSNRPALRDTKSFNYRRITCQKICPTSNQGFALKCHRVCQVVAGRFLWHESQDDGRALVHE